MEKYCTFLAAAEAQSFSAAAERLFLSPSAVSKHIAALEEELGAALFVRNKSGVRLTEAGRLCVPYMQRITELYRRMAHELGETGRADRLSLCSIPLQAAMGLPRLVGAFRAANPGLSLQLEERHGLHIAQAVLSGEFELAFSADRYLPLERLEYLELGGDSIVAVLPEGHPLANQETIALAGLRDDPFLLLPPATGTYGAYLELCSAAGFQPVVRLHTEREENLLQFVSQGMGVTLLPGRLARSVPVKGVCLAALEGDPRWRMLLIWARGRSLSPAAIKFRDFAVQFYLRSGVPGGQ